MQKPNGTFTLLLLVSFLGACSADPGGSLQLEILESPALDHSGEPHLQAGPDGKIILSWLEKKDQSATLRYSVFAQDEWANPRTVASGDDWFVNWADYPSITVVGPELWAAHWLQKKPGGTYAYDVKISLSRDGINWQPPISPHDDNTPTEHGFVSMIGLRGKLGAVWLDGRYTSETQSHETDQGSGDQDHDGMTLRWAAIGGDGRVVESVELDSLTCDCCQTDLVQVGGGAAVVYRDRSRDEIREIGIIRLTKDGWSEPAIVAKDDWKIAGCPVNGPAIDSRRDELAVAWFTAANDQKRVKVSFSEDGGHHFSSPVDISRGDPLGRVDVSWVTDDLVVVSWLEEQDDGKAALTIRFVSRDGTAGAEETIAVTGSERSSGFPQMLATGNELFFAWTDTGEIPRVLTARLPLAGLIGR